MSLKRLMKGVGKGSIFGHGRVFGMHKLWDTDIGKARDPFIRIKVLAQLSHTDSESVKTAIVQNLRERILDDLEPRHLSAFPLPILRRLMSYNLFHSNVPGSERTAAKLLSLTTSEVNELDLLKLCLRYNLQYRCGRRFLDALTAENHELGKRLTAVVEGLNDEKVAIRLLKKYALDPRTSNSDVAQFISNTTPRSTKVLDPKEKCEYRIQKPQGSAMKWLGGLDGDYVVTVSTQLRYLYSRKDIARASSLLEAIPQENQDAVLAELKRINPELESLLRGDDPT